MKRKYTLLSVIAVCATMLPCFAQEQNIDEPATFAGRASVAADWKIVRGLHLSAEYELRSTTGWSGIERNQAGIGLSYKVNDWFRVGTGYNFIGHYNSEKVLKPRHRVYLDLTGMVDFGLWRLSLKERLQLTHKSYDMNTFQEPLNGFGLKSKLKISYRGLRTLEPYAYVEVRNSFNDASFSADFDQTKGKFVNYSFDGYKTALLNRVRLSAGLEWEVGRYNVLNFGILADWNHERDLDVNAEGTKLKSLIWENGWAFALVLGYTFAF